MAKQTTATQRRNQVEAGKLLAQQEAAEREARLKKLYGPWREDAAYLRRCGFFVEAEVRGRYKVDNKTIDGETLKALADRERRLRGAEGEGVRLKLVTADGRKVGDKVEIVPKARSAARLLSTEKTGLGARKLSGAAATAAAKAAEHSADLGTPPRLEWIELDRLVIDRTYQREMNQKGHAHVGRILKAFNWNCYQPINVTAGTAETFAVIDGQHRLEAAKRHPLIDKLPCYVIDAPDVAHQAAVFVAVNSVRRALTSQQKFWAAHAAGDKASVALERACQQLKIALPRQPLAGLQPMALQAPLVASKIVGRLGIVPVKEALGLLAEFHAKDAGAFRSPFVAGLSAVSADTTIPRGKLRLTVKALDLTRLHAAAIAAGTGSGLAAAVEKILRRRISGGG